MTRLVVWDIDGTLLDTRRGVSSALRTTLQTHGFAADAETVRRIVHAPKLPEALATCAGVPQEAVMRVTNAFRLAYSQQGIYEADLYEGIKAALESLRHAGVAQAIASYKRHDLALAICAHFGLAEYCSPIVGADESNALSKKDLIRQCLAAHECPADGALYIGDMPTDKAAAEELCMRFLGVNYGYGFHGVPGYANEPEDIWRVLEGHIT